MNMEQFMERVESSNSAVELMGLFGEVNSPLLSKIGDDALNVKEKSA